MAGQKGGGTLATQIQNLESQLNEKQCAQAKKMAENEPSVVRLAFKLLGGKPARAQGLTKRNEQTFQQIKEEIGEGAAEKWKANRIDEKGKKND